MSESETETNCRCKKEGQIDLRHLHRENDKSVSGSDSSLTGSPVSGVSIPVPSTNVDKDLDRPQSHSFPGTHFLDYDYHHVVDANLNRRSYEYPEHQKRMAKRWNNRFYQKVSIMTHNDGE